MKPLISIILYLYCNNIHIKIYYYQWVKIKFHFHLPPLSGTNDFFPPCRRKISNFENFVGSEPHAGIPFIIEFALAQVII